MSQGKDAKAFPYEDIVDLPHPVSAKHRPMALTDRAAQFAPFAALTGFGGIITETARRTEKGIELTEESKAELDRRLAALMSVSGFGAPAEITYFVKDRSKDGGSYMTARGSLSRLDRNSGTLIMSDGSRIPADSVVSIESSIFSDVSEESGCTEY